MKITVKTTEVDFSIDTQNESLTQFKSLKYETLPSLEFVKLIVGEVERLHKEIVIAERKVEDEPAA